MTSIAPTRVSFIVKTHSFMKIVVRAPVRHAQAYTCISGAYRKQVILYKSMVLYTTSLDCSCAVELLECFAMNGTRSFLLELAFRHPHLLERVQRC